MKRKTVIVFEPDIDITSIICYSLNSAGFNAVAGNLQNFSEDIRKYKPEVIILDEWACRRSRLNLRRPERSALLITSTSPKGRQALPEYEADAFLEKPFDLSELEHLVAGLASPEGHLSAV